MIRALSGEQYIYIAKDADGTFFLHDFTNGYVWEDCCDLIDAYIKICNWYTKTTIKLEIHKMKKS